MKRLLRSACAMTANFNPSPARCQSTPTDAGDTTHVCQVEFLYLFYMGNSFLDLDFIESLGWFFSFSVLFLIFCCFLWNKSKRERDGEIKRNEEVEEIEAKKKMKIGNLSLLFLLDLFSLLVSVQLAKMIFPPPPVRHFGGGGWAHTLWHTLTHWYTNTHTGTPGRSHNAQVK